MMNWVCPERQRGGRETDRERRERETSRERQEGERQREILNTRSTMQLYLPIAPLNQGGEIGRASCRERV